MARLIAFALFALGGTLVVPCVTNGETPRANVTVSGGAVAEEERVTYAKCIDDYRKKHGAGLKGKAYRKVVPPSFVACKKVLTIKGDGAGLTPVEIMQVIRSNLNQVRHCYEDVLKTSPKTQGKLVMNWSIATGDGTVETVKVVEDKGLPPEMGSCAKGVIKNWIFPIPRGNQPVAVNYPFILNPL